MTADDSNNSEFGDLTVGDSQCSILQICDILCDLKSAGRLWTKLIDLSRRLKIPEDQVIPIKRCLSNATITYSTALHDILSAWVEKQGTNAKLNKLLSVLEKLHLKLCADALRLQFKPLENITESMTWNDLSDLQKGEISKKLINFQGKLMELGSFGNLEDLDGSILVQLAEGESIELVNNQVPNLPEYYIPRILKGRSKLKPELFKADYNDVFLVQNINRNALTILANGNGTDVSTNQIRRLTVRFILLEYEPDYEKIVKLSKAPVHWIKVNNNSYEWVKSSGSIQILQQYIHKQQDTVTIDEMASRKNKINILSDSPGMGKTVALFKITQEIIYISPPTTLVRLIILTEFVQALGKQKINIKNLSSLIAEQSSTFEFGRKMVKRAIKSGEIIFLMFDGFDEVLINQVDTAKKILQEVSRLESVRMFVTTRVHMREQLENTLEALGSLFEPLNESEQVNFLIRFWESRGINTNQAVEQFANSCLTALSKNVTGFESQITGIPLQCRMLAETNIEEAERCSELDSHVYQNPSSNILVTSIFEMYQQHMKMRLQEINCEDDPLVSLGMQTQNYGTTVKHAHMYYALELLFPEDKAQFLHLISSNFTVTRNELCRFGIVESSISNNGVQFVHRTFAEYFVAWFLVDENISDGLANFTLSHILKTYMEITEHMRPFLLDTDYNPSYKLRTYWFNFPVVCYFINEFTKNKPQLHSQLTSSISTMLHSSVYSECSAAIVASICHNYPYVMVQISKLLDFKDLIRKEETTEEPDDDDEPFRISPLHVAIKRGHYNMVEYLANKFGKELTELQYLLHFCVAENRNDNEAIISSKKEIIHLLLAKSGQWLEEIGANNETPVLQNRVHWELLECLIKKGANVNIYNSYKHTILHKLISNDVAPETYHHIVSLLCERKFKPFNLFKNYSISTPLLSAVNKIELLDDTLRLFHMNGADFNEVGQLENSILLNAITGRRSVRLIRQLIECGADVQHKTGIDDGCLHVSAQYGTTEALQYFLEFHSMDVNPPNKYGQTPLHLAFEWNSTDNECAQHLLITRGADVNATNNSNKLTPFLHAFQHYGIGLNIIKLMEENGLKVNKEIYSKALKIAISNFNIPLDNNFFNVLAHFIDKGGSLSSEGEENPWQFESVDNSMKDVVQATEVTSELLHHAKILNLLTAQELRQIESAEESLKAGKFYSIMRGKKGSFEKVVKCLIFSNQLYALLKFRKTINLQLKEEGEYDYDDDDDDDDLTSSSSSSSSW